MPLLKVALMGRPNVGKSTLFNRLVGKPQALVDETPGVTRDWQTGMGRIGDLTFQVIDTAGFESEKKGTLGSRMWDQSVKALESADVILFVIDAKEGVVPLDLQMAKWVRTQNKPVILVANKAENSSARLQMYEMYTLGFEEALFISAAHGQGLLELYQALKKYGALEEESSHDESSEKTENDPAVHNKPIDLAIVGRPNAGKSTFVNALLGEERLLTGEEAGITRDAIASPFSYDSMDFRLIDTAGLRKRAKVTQKIERLSGKDTVETIRLSQGVVLVLDALSPLEKQDLTIARFVVEEGRILVLALNKWDLVKNPDQKFNEIQELLIKSLPQIRGVPCIPISALKKRNIKNVLKEVLDLYALWNKRLSTAELNRWLEEAVRDHAPPVIKGRFCKIRYVTQVKARPPTFLAFSNLKDSDWPESYRRYLVNSLRQTFGLGGIPLRLQFRTSKNPYVES